MGRPVRRRIIPARAGFTERDHHQPHQGRDHPRSRGVYPPRRSRRPSRPGSSPLARGLHATSCAACHQFGIIPARAGFTLPRHRGRHAGEDHPRSRGVYRRTCARVRRRSWIIPARAGFTPDDLGPAVGQRDHPRSRGVYHQDGVPAVVQGGSSPLARGLHLTAFPTIPAGGIIPARAGFTAWPTWPLGPATDHPRSRGVYRNAAVSSGRRLGSSPLARGLPHARRRLRGRPGIIPARAGFTPPRPQDHRSRRDHPRSRGVYPRPPTGRTGRPGSSPLARGLRAEGGVGHVCMGIIPARAGFTERLPQRLPVGRDHPRSRGVYSWGARRRPVVPGSSPLARGLPPRECPGCVRSGIIPARAGFTARGGARPGPIQDHPRSRGVYRLGGVWPVGGLGSSPLARGLRMSHSLAEIISGIIPARAGFTASSRPRASAGSDHPRSRGVYGARLKPGARDRGSSPLARGLHRRRRRPSSNRRIIPARAGFTTVCAVRARPGKDHPRSRGVYM